MNLVYKHEERNFLSACYKNKGFVLQKRGLFLKNIFQRNIREQVFKHKGVFYFSGFLLFIIQVKSQIIS